MLGLIKDSDQGRFTGSGVYECLMASQVIIKNKIGIGRNKTTIKHTSVNRVQFLGTRIMFAGWNVNNEAITVPGGEYIAVYPWTCFVAPINPDATYCYTLATSMVVMLTFPSLLSFTGAVCCHDATSEYKVDTTVIVAFQCIQFRIAYARRLTRPLFGIIMMLLLLTLFINCHYYKQRPAPVHYL